MEIGMKQIEERRHDAMKHDRGMINAYGRSLTDMVTVDAIEDQLRDCRQRRKAAILKASQMMREG